MNWDQVKGNWKQFTGQVKQKWGKLTDDDLTTAEGKRDELAGKLQEKYGMAKEDAERELDDFVQRMKMS
ncbi:MAG: CsbD family protein [Gemmataceae bacterium]